MTKDIFEYINILLPKHKCVSIPDFGAFILNKEAEESLTAQSVLLPPKYTVLFNSKLHHDDGVLSSYIQQVDGVSYEKASKELSSAVKELKKRLLVDREVRCGRFGKLELKEGNLTFIQDENYIYPLHYGLTSVNLSTLDILSRVIEEENKVVSFKKKVVMVAASAAVALLLILPSSNITDSSVRGGNLEAGYLRSLVTTQKVADKPEELPMIGDLALEEETVEIEESAVEAEPEIDLSILESVKVIAESKVHKPITEKNIYYLTVAGETSLNKANALIQELKEKGFDSTSLFVSGNMYKIYIDKFTDKTVAEKSIEKFKKQNSEYTSASIFTKKVEH